MEAAIVLAAALGLAVLWYLAAPLRRTETPRPEIDSPSLGEARELRSRHEMLLSALRDLEDDHATGKIGKADYEPLRVRLYGSAIEVMKRLDLLEAQCAEHADRATRPLQHPSAASAGPET